MAETEPNSRYRALLNAIPLWAFVVDEDVRVQDLNDAAAAVFAPDKTVVLDRTGGEVLRCLHWQDSPKGCGHGPFCPACVIRNSVRESLKGGHVSRRRASVTLISAGLKKPYDLLVTANPMPGTDEPLALLVIEDVSELATLRGIIPICARCKQVRDDQEYWQSVETYFTEHMGVDFSHGVCPSCEQELYPAAADD
jgi:PAS domain-containing protein